MAALVGMNLGADTETPSGKYEYEPLVSTAQPRPSSGSADEVLLALTLSKLPGGVAPGKLCPVTAAQLGLPITGCPEHKAARELSAGEHLLSWHWRQWGTKPASLGGWG